ncbi:MAG: zinc ribbon domain-containing protein [Gemmatimonadales bacterium]
MTLEIVAAVLVGLAAVWGILQPLVGGRPVRAAVYEPPDPEDTAKGVALAALKEIEFDRETGKLSDEDYAFLKRKYTGAALEALREEEAGGSADGAAEATATATPELGGAGGHGDVEAMIAARVRALRFAAASAPLGGATCPLCGPRPEADAVFCSTCGRRMADGGACASCGAALDVDSRFCAQCGAGVAA